MALLPLMINDEILDGTYIRVLPYCKKSCSSEKCRKYYKNLQQSPCGFYTCPNGLTSLVCQSSEGKRFIYSCLRVRKYYDKSKAKIAQSTQNVYNPVLDEEQIIALTKEDISYQSQMESTLNVVEEAKDTLHEARKFNAQIKNLCDLIWDENPDEDLSAQEISNLFKRISNIHICSYLAYNRFSYYDISTNPELTYGEPYETGVFKKFDKLRMLLKGYARKNVWISLEDQNTYTYKIYPTFETLIFIILENAIKYSPKNKPVNVYFHEYGKQLDVVVVSQGPYCDDEELKKITDKGYRGSNALLCETPGEGIGLSFAKKIADIHGITMLFSSTYSSKLNGIPFGEFCVTLHFSKNE